METYEDMEQLQNSMETQNMEDNRCSNSKILKETARDTQQLWETTGDMEQLQNS